MTNAELSRDLQNDLGWLDRPGYGPEDATKNAAIIACRRALAAEAEIVRLHIALRPFAEIAKLMSKTASGELSLYIRETPDSKAAITLDDCRRAAELLEAKP